MKISSHIKYKNKKTSLVSREETQAKMDRRAVAANRIKPRNLYTVADRLEARAECYAERDFLIYGDQIFSYQEVNCRANRVAHAALEMGLKPGDTCAIALENRPEFFFTWFGLARVGVVVAFLNTQVNGVPLRHAVVSTHARAVIVGEECAHHFAMTDGLGDTQLWLLSDPEKPALASDLLLLGNEFQQRLETAPDSPVSPGLRPDIKAEDPAILIFTSGTTGLPKAAIYSHMRWLSSGDVMEVTLDAKADDVFYCCLPLYHGAGATSVTATALAAGAAIVLRRRFSVRNFWDDICGYRVTICQYIGEICRYLLNYYDSAPPHHLRCMVGAGLTRETWNQWQARFGQMDIFEGWGATEANTNLINLDNYAGSCGRIPDWNKTNFRLVKFDVATNQYLRDDNGFLMLCQPGEVGEGIGYIVDHPEMGGGRFEGYTSPEATEQKILRNVFEAGDAYWRSGDLLQYDDHGYFYFVDRLGDTYRWKSENVSTQEVAGALGDYSGLELINIYGVLVPDHEGRAGMAAIVMQDGCRFDPQSFYDLTADRLPDYAAPLFVRISQKADLTTTCLLYTSDAADERY
ncbi:long-chain-acyl-CoA synthetase, partial [Endozoicomonas sp.]|uniref:long-chain-acyl-CoA synthetase n=1 Tax=Endozoicomonas sp. TaxID=1892382 RepID=UPI00383B3C85